MTKLKRGVRISKVSADSVKKKSVLIVAGEASADQHGANLVKSILRQDPAVVFRGIGGEQMAHAGVAILFSSTEMAVVGLTEVIPRIGVIYKAATRLKRALKNDRPDLLILLDYPDFNIHLARTAKQCGVPVLYYISPQVWAWRRGRIKKIGKRVDRMAVILPFEEDFYRKSGIRVDYVGHPLLDTWHQYIASNSNVPEPTVFPGFPILGLVPGSRSEEVRSLLPSMIAAAEILKNNYPKLSCILPVAPTVDEELVKNITGHARIDVVLRKGSVYEALKSCTAVIAASGTVTLEVALMEIPMVVVYRVSKLSYHIAKRIVRVPHISLVNLVAGMQVVPELIQKDAAPENIVREAKILISDRDARRRMMEQLELVRTRLGDRGASTRAAEIALEMMR